MGEVGPSPRGPFWLATVGLPASQAAAASFTSWVACWRCAGCWPRGDWVSWLRGDWTSWLRAPACGPLVLRPLADSTSAHCCAADADGGPSIMRQVSDRTAGTSLFLERTNARAWRQELHADRHDRRV